MYQTFSIIREKTVMHELQCLAFEHTQSATDDTTQLRCSFLNFKVTHQFGKVSDPSWPICKFALAHLQQRASAM